MEVLQCVDKAYSNEILQLIAVEGAKTPAGGKDMEDPAGRSPRRLPDCPRKAKLLQRRSTFQQIT
ncbi:hypothetical protein EKQ44_12070 [Sutcliffiella horikoshii]|nr:hypothetical protein [Sutcliffiella horikoshii]